jgi:sugar/nucleoside kinase (ribokinase family)
MPPADPEIVVAGHVCLDFIPAFDRPAPADESVVRPGGLTVIGPAHLSTGGAVSNTGLGLHRLGVRVALMGKVGDDLFGRELLRIVRSHGTTLATGMRITEGETTSYTVVIGPPGVDRAFLHCPGANDRFDAGDLDLGVIGRARLLHFGYPPIMRRLWEDGTGAALAKLMGSAKATGVTTSLDLCSVDPNAGQGKVDWRAMLSVALPEVDVFAPSLDELLFMLKRPANIGVSAETLSVIAQDLLAMGSAIVAIKLGEDGLYLRTTPDRARLARAGRAMAGLEAAEWSGRELLAPCFRVNVVNTNGAGDCTIAGFLAALVRGDGPAPAVTDATAVGACCCEAPDATSGVRPWAEVRQRLAAGWPRRPTRVAFSDDWRPLDPAHPDGLRAGPNDRSA